MKVFYPTLFLSFFCMTALLAQEVVYLKNPSFEDIPKYGSVPGAWRNCAFNNESPPDIHPIKDGLFGVRQEPLNGRSYIGLVARDNSTTESIGQELLMPLKADQCYSLSLALCRSDKLISRSRLTGEMQNFNLPVCLRIWGGLSPCGRKSLLAVSPQVDNIDWKKYTFHFKPEEDLTWLSFEVYYMDGATGAYNGNLLIDNASAIIPISCEDQEALVADSDIQQPEYNYVNYGIPDNVRSLPFFSAYGATGFFIDFRVVDKPVDINALILDNCPDMGFQFSSHFLTDEYGIALKEIAVNVQKHKNTVLLLGTPYVGNELVTKRKRTLRRIFREIGLTKHQYEIVVLPPDWAEEEWLCGGQELWLKLQEEGTEN